MISKTESHRHSLWSRLQSPLLSLLLLFGCLQFPTPTRAAENVDANDMTWMAGGEFDMGATSPLGQDDNVVGMQSTQDPTPIHRVRLDGYWIDKTEVTNAEFAKFVASAKYVTLAEKPLSEKDFPGIAKDMLAPGSAVFTPPNAAVPLDYSGQNYKHTMALSWDEYEAYAEGQPIALPYLPDKPQISASEKIVEQSRQAGIELAAKKKKP